MNPSVLSKVCSLVVVHQGCELGTAVGSGLAVDDALAEEDNAAPTALAAFWKAENEVFVPSAPGLTANTIPLPQWLAGVNSFCRQ
jgi:hypothetical protein